VVAHGCLKGGGTKLRWLPRREAVAAVERENYDLVLMTYRCPNGRLRSHRAFRMRRPAGRHLPIFAMTARAMKGDAERCARRAWWLPAQADQIRGFYAIVDGCFSLPETESEPAPRHRLRRSSVSTVVQEP